MLLQLLENQVQQLKKAAAQLAVVENNIMIPLVKGSFGDSVLTLQKALQKKGYKIDIIEAKTFEQVIRQLENYKK